ncbi:MAG: flagellar biosynthesis protein FlhB [Casimicrobiaceae bacterium]
MDRAAMAEEQDQERNHPASARRLEQARERGQVARSRELTAAAVALAAALALTFAGGGLWARSADVFAHGLALDRSAAFDSSRMIEAITAQSGAMLEAMAPLLICVLLATLLAPMLMSGWVFSTEALAPDFARLDPRKGLKNLLSARSLGELAKALIKCALIGGIGGGVLWHFRRQLVGLAQSDVGSGVASLADIASTSLYVLTGALLLIAAIDVPYALWRHYSGLRMSREELRQEMREMEGDPHQKARVRSVQRATARKRMMAAVPTASVVVTNPTHYAVALEYSESGMRAPRVVAKGAGVIAQKIRELAAANDVPRLEAPPLARALYRHAEVGDEIPPALYTVVAQVLAYVYRVEAWRRHGGRMPDAPSDLDVPPGLDPAAAGAQ